MQSYQSLQSVPLKVVLLASYPRHHLAKVWEFATLIGSCALLAQLDRASDYESEGRWFESSRARHFINGLLSIGYRRASHVVAVVRSSSSSKILVPAAERWPSG